MNKRLFLMMIGLFSVFCATFAADRLIKGTVIASEDNSPLIGASVYITPEDLKKAGVGNNPIGVITDIDGNFSINVPSGVKRIYCSFVGYDVKETILQSNKSKYEIVLHPTSVMMDGVVVTGYQTLERRKLTAAVSKVDMSEERIGAARSIDQALAGQVAGLSVVNTTGAPGAPAKIRIRGTSSLNGTQDPLWVLDGIPLEGTDIPKLEEVSNISDMQQSSIAGLSPSDIENITILKDAAATAIYGARAANGVIVITTKKGKVGKPKVNFSAKLTYSPKHSLDRLNLLNADQKVDLELDLIKGKFNPNSEKGGVYNILKTNGELAAFQADGWDALSQTSKDAINGLRSINTNWGDILFRDVFNQEYNVNISGGNEKVTYYTSLGYTKENGNVPQVSMDRFNFVGKTSYKVNKLLKVGASLFANRRKNSNFMSDTYGLSNPMFYSYRANPYMQPYDENGNYIYDYDIQPSSDRDLEYNIFEERNNTTYDNVVTSIQAIFDAELKFDERFKLSTQFGYQYDNSTTDQMADKETFYIRNERKKTQYYDSSISGYNNFLPDGGVHIANSSNNSQITWKSMFEYRDTFKNDHELEFMLGSELRRNWNESQYSKGYGFDRKTLTVKPVIFPKESMKNYLGKFHQYNKMTNAYASFFSTLSYSYLNRYTLGGSIRFDGSDLFGVDKKYRFLPLYSFSALWRISHEPFMKNATWVDNLAIRASYGLQGNIDKNTSPFLLGKYEVNDILPGIYEDMIEVNSAPNNKLRWEKTSSVNAGLDFSVLHSAINLSVDYYYRKGTDLIGMRMLPLETGFTSQSINWASMENQGVEVALATRNISTKYFTWNMNINFAYNSNKVLRENILESQNTPSREGYPAEAIFAIPTAGVNPENGQLMFYNPAGEKVTLTELYGLHDPYAGNPWMEGFMVASKVGPKEEREFYRYMGSGDTPYTGGFINTFTYKNWELSANITFNFGGFVRTRPSYDIINPDLGKNFNQDILNRWTPENKNGQLPGIITSDMNFMEFGWYDQVWNNLDIWVKKLNYARLQNLRLSYRVPGTFARKLLLEGATVALEGRNLCVFGSSYKNYLDPETMTNPYAMPIPRSFVFSLNLNF